MGEAPKRQPEGESGWKSKVLETYSSVKSEVKERIKDKNVQEREKMKPNLKEHIDTLPKKRVYKKTHEIGSHDIKQEDLPQMDPENKAYTLVGKVDRVRHKKVHDKEWYLELKSDSDLFYKLFDEVEIDFPSLKNNPKNLEKMKEILNNISKLNKSKDLQKEFEAMIVKNGYKDAEIFGPEGALNLVKAFQRSVETMPRGVLMSANFVQALKSLPVLFKILKIRLEVSDKQGEDKSSRSSEVYETDLSGLVGKKRRDSNLETANKREKISAYDKEKGKEKKEAVSLDELLNVPGYENRVMITSVAGATFTKSNGTKLKMGKNAFLVTVENCMLSDGTTATTEFFVIKDFDDPIANPNKRTYSAFSTKSYYPYILGGTNGAQDLMDRAVKRSLLERQLM